MRRHFGAMAVGALFLAFALCSLAPYEAAALPKFKLKGKWKLIKKRGKLRVYQMKVRGSRLIAMRGDAEFDAPIAKVFYLLNNVPRKVKWVDRMIKAKYISKTNATNYVTYTRFDFPWPAADRDFVNKTETHFYPKKKQIIRYQWSVNVASHPPKKGVVRALVHFSSYTLTSIDNDTRTKMVAVGYGDPKGTIPAFIVNFIQRRWPLKNMKTIKKQLKKSWVIAHPVVKEKLFAPPKPAPRPMVDAAAASDKRPAPKAPARQPPPRDAAPAGRRPEPRK